MNKIISLPGSKSLLLLVRTCFAVNVLMQSRVGEAGAAHNLILHVADEWGNFWP